MSTVLKLVKTSSLRDREGLACRSAYLVLENVRSQGKIDGLDERRLTVGELGNEAELEKLSSNLDSERQVEIDLAEPELIDPVPRKQESRSSSTG